MILFIFLNNIVTKEYILHRYVITYTFSVFVNNLIEIIKVHINKTHETPNMTFIVYMYNDSPNIPQNISEFLINLNTPSWYQNQVCEH